MANSPRNENGLTDMQQAVVDCLWDSDVRGDVSKAMLKAGYAESTKIDALLRGNQKFADAIIESAKTFLAINSVKAANAIVEGIDTPTSLGLDKRLKAADSLLDRAGIAKKQNIEVETTDEGPIPILILPPKKAIEENTDNNNSNSE